MHKSYDICISCLYDIYIISRCIIIIIMYYMCTYICVNVYLYLVDLSGVATTYMYLLNLFLYLYLFLCGVIWKVLGVFFFLVLLLVSLFWAWQPPGIVRRLTQSKIAQLYQLYHGLTSSILDLDKNREGCLNCQYIAFF